MIKDSITKLILESDGNTIQWETPHSDTSMEDLLYAFYGLCVAASWNPMTVLKKMRDFVDERIDFFNNVRIDDISNSSDLYNFHKEPLFDTSCTSKDYSDSMKYTQETI